MGRKQEYTLPVDDDTSNDHHGHSPHCLDGYRLGVDSLDDDCCCSSFEILFSETVEWCETKKVRLQSE